MKGLTRRSLLAATATLPLFAVAATAQSSELTYAGSGGGFGGIGCQPPARG